MMAIHFSSEVGQSKISAAPARKLPNKDSSHYSQGFTFVDFIGFVNDKRVLQLSAVNGKV
jgi:hypothetical protein